MRNVRDFLVGTMYWFLGNCLAPFFRSSKSPFQPRRILVLKPCCIGDVLMSTALVGQLREAFPQARLDFAVGPWSKDVIADSPRIDDFVDCGPVGSGGPYGWKGYWALVDAIKRGRYDTCFVLERSALLTLIPFLAGIPNRIGIDSGGRGFSLTVKVPWNSMRHEAELYLDLARAVGMKLSNPELEFWPSETDNSWANERFKELAAGPDGEKISLVAIFPGGAANPGMKLPAKRWLPDRYTMVTERFLRGGWRVVLLGAADDKPLVGELIESLRNSMGEEVLQTMVLDLAGETSLGQLGAVYRHCQLFIGNDTGPMHLAVASGTPVVAIFGPSTPEMYGPYGLKTRTVYKQVDCSPCFLKGRFAADCTDRKCMKVIEVEDVWRAASSLVPDLVGLQEDESGVSIG